MLDIDRPVVAVAITMLIVSVLLVSIAMDMRRLPVGRIKYVPWTYLTITAVMALLPAVRHLIAVLLR